MSAARFVAYTDGSCLKNPGGPGGAGFIVFDRALSALRFGAERYTCDGAFEVTNNRMEMRAVLHALEGLPGGETVEVVSDSRYLIDALTRWIHGWRRRGWKTAEGQAVQNRDLIESLDACAGRLTVSYRWVRGHAGDPLNELVDKLAQASARGSAGPSKEEIVRELHRLLPAADG